MVTAAVATSAVGYYFLRKWLNNKLDLEKNESRRSLDTPKKSVSADELEDGRYHNLESKTIFFKWLSSHILLTFFFYK